MKRNITLVVLSIGIALLLGACSKLAQVTNHKNCDPSLLNASLEPTVPIFADADATSVVKERIAPGSIVRVYDYRNHQANPKPFVRVKTEKVEGWMNPRCLVVGQDPEKSVLFGVIVRTMFTFTVRMTMNIILTDTSLRIMHLFQKIRFLWRSLRLS